MVSFTIPTGIPIKYFVALAALVKQISFKYLCGSEETL